MTTRIKQLLTAVLPLFLLMFVTSVSKGQDTSSVIQLTIQGATISGHCVPADPPSDPQGVPFQSGGRTITIIGFNFNNAGIQPTVTLGGTPLTVTGWTPTSITVSLDCGQFSAGSYRLNVSTGQA